MMAIILGVIMGLAGIGMTKLAFVLQLFVMVMLIIWAMTNFCPSIFILKKFMPPCDFKENE